MKTLILVLTLSLAWLPAGNLSAKDPAKVKVEKPEGAEHIAVKVSSVAPEGAIGTLFAETKVPWASGGSGFNLILKKTDRTVILQGAKDLAEGDFIEAYATKGENWERNGRVLQRWVLAKEIKRK